MNNSNINLELNLELDEVDKQTKIGIYSKMFNAEYCLIALLSIVSLIFFYGAYKLFGSFSWSNIYQMTTAVLLIVSAVAVVANVAINIIWIKQIEKGDSTTENIGKLFSIALKVLAYLIIISTFIMSLIAMVLAK